MRRRLCRGYLAPIGVMSIFTVFGDVDTLWRLVPLFIGAMCLLHMIDDWVTRPPGKLHTFAGPILTMRVRGNLTPEQTATYKEIVGVK